MHVKRERVIIFIYDGPIIQNITSAINYIYSVTYPPPMQGRSARKSHPLLVRRPDSPPIGFASLGGPYAALHPLSVRPNLTLARHCQSMGETHHSLLNPKAISTLKIALSDAHGDKYQAANLFLSRESSYPWPGILSWAIAQCLAHPSSTTTHGWDAPKPTTTPGAPQGAGPLTPAPSREAIK